jgi:hypothetical protein
MANPRPVTPLIFTPPPVSPTPEQLAAAVLEVPVIRALLEDAAKAAVRRRERERRIFQGALAAVAVLAFGLLGAVSGGVLPAAARAALLALGLGAAFWAGRSTV